MLNQLMNTAAVLIAPKEEAFVDANVEVLAHCPYHAQIDFYRAARDTFLESQGLVDIQEFVVRDEIINRKKSVAIEQMIYRENTTMLWNGGYSIVHCAIEYYDLYSKLYNSDNWTTEYNRLQEGNIMQFGMEAYMTFNKVNELWAQEAYVEAGKAFANGMFPKTEKKESSVDWDPLPYNEAYAGEELAGYVSGSITMFTNRQNRDNLAECLTNQETLLSGFQESHDSIMKRYNADIEDGVAHMRTVYMSLGEASENCSDETKEEIKMIQDRLDELDSDTIISNLVENKHHVELSMAMMKMYATEHDFDNQGQRLSSLYIALTGQ